MNQLTSNADVWVDRCTVASVLAGPVGRKSRKRLVLEAMQRNVDWAGMWSGGEAARQSWEAQHPGISAQSMFKTHCLQQWFGLTDIGMEEALLDMPLYRDFAHLASPALPDSRHMRQFRALLKSKLPDMRVPAIPSDVMALAQTSLRTQRNDIATDSPQMQRSVVIPSAAPTLTTGRFIKINGALTVCKQPLLVRSGRGRRMLTPSESGRRHASAVTGKPSTELPAPSLPDQISPMRTEEGASRCGLLSKRELQTLLRIAAGKRLSDIAEDLMLSPKTVSVYRARMLEKLQLTNNAQLTVYAIRQGLV